MIQHSGDGMAVAVLLGGEAPDGTRGAIDLEKVGRRRMAQLDHRLDRHASARRRRAIGSLAKEVQSQLRQSRKQMTQLSAQMREGQVLTEHVRLQVVAMGQAADARYPETSEAQAAQIANLTSVVELMPSIGSSPGAPPMEERGGAIAGPSPAASRTTTGATDCGRFLDSFDAEGRPRSLAPLFPDEGGSHLLSKEAMLATIVHAGRLLKVPLQTTDGSERISGHSLRVTAFGSHARKV